MAYEYFANAPHSFGSDLKVAWPAVPLVLLFRREKLGKADDSIRLVAASALGTWKMFSMTQRVRLATSGGRNQRT